MNSNLILRLILISTAVIFSACTYEGVRLAERQKCARINNDSQRNKCFDRWDDDDRDTYRKMQQSAPKY